MEHQYGGPVARPFVHEMHAKPAVVDFHEVCFEGIVGKVGEALCGGVEEVHADDCTTVV